LNPPIPLPARIAKYELLEFLGGGMSHVFRARDTVLGRTVAIKILTPAGVADPDTKARFLQEARTASNISHENILAVYDFGDEGGKPYMVMEFLRGRTLRAAIRDQLLADPVSKLRVAIQVARALGYVHQNQIIHRDVKPENVNLDDSGRAKLMDFGIAKAADLSLTQPGYVLGTPYYMAPEQIMGKPVTPSVDIYAFGIMLYEMLLGTRPYSGETIETIFYKIMNEPLDLSPLAMAGVPGEAVAIVARCTKKEPAERYADFNGVVTDLENALGTQVAPKISQTTVAPDRKSKAPLLAAIGGAVVLLAGAGLFFAYHNPAPEPKPPEKKEQPPPPPEARIATPTGFMRLVPAGAFLSGEKKQAGQTGAFYIDETEVSNQNYARFCTETHRDPPRGRPELPVVNVTIADAREYAGWTGKRLPTAKEWEKAARGKDGQNYPWGNEKGPNRANVAVDQKPSLIKPVDAFAESASPYGALNMVGNVWELIEGPIVPNAAALKDFHGLSPPATAAEPWVSLRGGSYKSQLDPGLSWDFVEIPERYKSDDIGFRCVKDVK
jgi:serine/threonine protein kinase